MVCQQRDEILRGKKLTAASSAFEMEDVITYSVIGLNRSGFVDNDFTRLPMASL